MQHRLAESLARYGAGGQAGSADGVPSLDKGDALAQLRRLNGAALSGWTAANADEIVVERVGHWLSKLQPTRLLSHGDILVVEQSRVLLIKGALWPAQLVRKR
jgi:hypothetical protein